MYTQVKLNQQSKASLYKGFSYLFLPVTQSHLVYFCYPFSTHTLFSFCLIEKSQERTSRGTAISIAVRTIMNLTSADLTTTVNGMSDDMYNIVKLLLYGSWQLYITLKVLPAIYPVMLLLSGHYTSCGSCQQYVIYYCCCLEIMFHAGLASIMS